MEAARGEASVAKGGRCAPFSSGKLPSDSPFSQRGLSGTKLRRGSRAAFATPADDGGAASRPRAPRLCMLATMDIRSRDLHAQPGGARLLDLPPRSPRRGGVPGQRRTPGLHGRPGDSFGGRVGELAIDEPLVRVQAGLGCAARFPRLGLLPRSRRNAVHAVVAVRDERCGVLPGAPRVLPDTTHAPARAWPDDYVRALPAR